MKTPHVPHTRERAGPEGATRCHRVLVWRWRDYGCAYLLWKLRSEWAAATKCDSHVLGGHGQLRPALGGAELAQSPSTAPRSPALSPSFFFGGGREGKGGAGGARLPKPKSSPGQ